MKRSDDTTDVFVHLANDRDRVVGAFCGEPLVRHTHWVDGRSETCTGDGCRLCSQRRQRRVRATMNFYVPARRKMRVIEGGERFLKDIVKVWEKYGLDGWLYEVERHGKFGDSKTYYTILPERPIDQFLQVEMKTVELHDLESIGEKHANKNSLRKAEYNAPGQRLALVS
jgi:hypothetical protein